jgi:hypothetical protein
LLGGRLEEDHQKIYECPPPPDLGTKEKAESQIGVPKFAPIVTFIIGGGSYSTYIQHIKIN